MTDTGTPHHSGDAALDVMRSYGVDVMFTLNGGHVWPLYDAAVKQDVRIVDVRHEQTATFAAEGWAKLTRKPGLAVLTAGPGVTNGVSAITTAHFNGTPLVVLGGRAPQRRWGSGSLQELDHVPIVASITKSARTVTAANDTAKEIQHAVLDRDDAAPGTGVRRLPDGRDLRSRLRAGGERQRPARASILIPPTWKRPPR